jgi:hypothetical protein
MFGIEQAFAAPSEGAAAAGIIAGGVMTICIISIVFWILLIVARWKIFTKAGEAGWKSIIPIYADYVQWRIGWKKTGLFWVMILLVIVGSILIAMSGSYEVSANGAVIATGGGNSILSIIGVVAILAAGILELVAAYKLMDSFGHGIGWLILFIIIPNIMLLVLGFGSSRYFGPSE